MTAEIVKAESLPAKARTDPVRWLATLAESAVQVVDTAQVQHRIALIDAVRAYHAKFGKDAKPILLAADAARLLHVSRLGELLAATVTRAPASPPREHVLPDDMLTRLPPGISRNLSSQAQALAAAPQQWVKEVAAGIADGTAQRPMKGIVLEARRKVAAAAAPVLPDNLLVGDFREAGREIADASVSLVFSDPPYDRNSLPLYPAVAEFAARVLLPGGSLVLYAPTYALPKVLADIGDTLRYWWTLVVIHSGGRALMQEYGVRVGYKPLLWYTKGGRHDKHRIIGDVIVSAEEKGEHHEWQQAVIDARTVIEALTSPGDLVVDPMAGSGTTLVAARDSGRQWCGIEVNRDTAGAAAKRLGST